jgi:hypothetical protein
MTFVRKNEISVGDVVMWEEREPDTVTLKFIKTEQLRKHAEQQEEVAVGE